MKFTKIKGILTLIIFGLISYFGKIKIYPCKSSPVIAVPKYTWKLCGADVLTRRIIVGVHEMYCGFNQGWIIALALNLVIAYLIVSLVVYLYKKYKK